MTVSPSCAMSPSLVTTVNTGQYCEYCFLGAERTVSGSKYPEESPKNLKPKHSRHKQLSVDLEYAFQHKEFCDVQVGSLSHSIIFT